MLMHAYTPDLWQARPPSALTQEQALHSNALTGSRTSANETSASPICVALGVMNRQAVDKRVKDGGNAEQGLISAGH